jgi:hypothetical protein
MIRSMMYMIPSVNWIWYLQTTFPNIGSEQLSTCARAMTATVEENEDVRKKYDSANLKPKMSVQSATLAVRAARVSGAYAAVKVCEAMYLRDLPATRSPNIRPEGITPKAIEAVTERPN